MKFYVTEDVFKKMPNAKFGLVSVGGIDNSAENPGVTALLNAAIASCEEHFAGKTVKQEPELAPYRAAFTNMGINPNKFMSSIEALLTRIAKGKGMPHINPVVDIGNAISLRWYLPVGAHDLDSMFGGAFAVRTATAEDTFLPFGAEAPEKPDVGEVVYATGTQIRTRRWIWRQSEAGKITETTKNLLFILDGFEENLDAIIKGRDELAAKLHEAFGCETKTGLIDAENREFATDIGF